MSIEITLWGIIWNLPLINYRIALCSAWDDDSPRQCYIKWFRAGSSIRLFRGQTDSNRCKTVQTGAKRCTEKDMLMITARIEDYLLHQNGCILSRACFRKGLDPQTLVLSASSWNCSDISSINSILQNVMIAKYYFSDARQSRTTSSFHRYHSRYYRRWSLAVVVLSYAQLRLISEQNPNCSDIHAHLIQALTYDEKSIGGGKNLLL